MQYIPSSSQSIIILELANVNTYTNLLLFFYAILIRYEFAGGGYIGVLSELQRKLLLGLVNGSLKGKSSTFSTLHI